MVLLLAGAGLLTVLGPQVSAAGSLQGPADNGQVGTPSSSATSLSTSGSPSVTSVPSAFPPGILYYVPVTVANSQPIATEAPFDTFLQVSCSLVASYAPANLQNIEFFASDGQIVPSWHYSGNCVTSPSEASYWLSLSGGVAANSNYTFYMGMGATDSNLLNKVNTGAAPTCYDCAPTAPYGTYDDGASVFPYYQAWGGLSALPAGWSVTTSGGLSFSFGATETAITPAGSSGAELENNTSDLTAVQQPFFWEAYGAFANPSNGVGSGAGLIDTAQISESWGGASNLGCDIGGSIQNFGTDTSGNHLYAIEVSNPSSSNWASAIYEDSAYAGCSVSGYSVPPPAHQGLYMPLDSGTKTLYWNLIRTDPPNGVMPSASFGSVSPAPADYTVQFAEAGLPAGSTWSVSLANYTKSASSPATINFTEPNGTYNFAVTTIPGYFVSAPTGTVSVTGRSQLVNVTFSPGSLGNFEVTFVESGLPSGTIWNVTLNQSTVSTSGGSIAFAEPNGTYAFTVGNVPNYIASPEFGAVRVSGGPVTEVITFSHAGYLQVAVVPGIANVTVDGQSAPGSGGTYTWTLTPGSYYVNATLSGFLPFSDSVTVSAGQTTVLSVVLTAVTSYGNLVGKVSPSTATVIANGVVLPLTDGEFNATLAPGAYYLSLTASGYQSQVAEENITQGVVTHADFTLVPLTSTVSFGGVVVPSDSSVLLNGFVAYVNKSGDFQVSVVTGTYVVSVYAPGYFPFAEEVTLTNNSWVKFILTPEPASPTSTWTSGGIRVVGYNLTVTGLTNGSSSIGVNFTAQTNGTLVVSVPYSDVKNATIAEVLASRVYINGLRYTNFTVSITSNYTVFLSASGLSSDPELTWLLSPSAVPPGPQRRQSSATFFGLPGELGYAVLFAALVAVGASAAAVRVARHSKRARTPAQTSRTESTPADSTTSLKVSGKGAESDPSGEDDPLRDFI